MGSLWKLTGERSLLLNLGVYLWNALLCATICVQVGFPDISYYERNLCFLRGSVSGFLLAFCVVIKSIGSEVGYLDLKLVPSLFIYRILGTLTSIGFPCL